MGQQWKDHIQNHSLAPIFRELSRMQQKVAVSFRPSNSSFLSWSNIAVFGKAYKCSPQFYNKGVQFGQGELEILLLCMMQTVLIIF